MPDGRASPAHPLAGQPAESENREQDDLCRTEDPPPLTQPTDSESVQMEHISEVTQLLSNVRETIVGPKPPDAVPHPVLRYVSWAEAPVLLRVHRKMPRILAHPTLADRIPENRPLCDFRDASKDFDIEEVLLAAGLLHYAPALLDRDVFTVGELRTGITECADVFDLAEIMAPAEAQSPMLAKVTRVMQRPSASW